MAAEDYDDVPGFGGGTWTPSYKPKAYTCNFCREPITFNQRKALNKDGTPHRCKTTGRAHPSAEANTQATLYAMAAMNAIISGSIHSGGVDHIHRMNFYDVADAAWQCAAAMVKSERNYRDDITQGERERGE